MKSSDTGMLNLRMPKTHSAMQRTQKSSAQGAVNDSWHLRRVSGVQVLSAAIFNAVPWIVHGFSTRAGGASSLDGAGVLNLAFTDWDLRETVAENREQFVDAVCPLSWSGKSTSRRNAQISLITLQQVHSDIVYVVRAAAPGVPQGDAAICDRAGLLLGIQAADCVAILMADTRRRVVAAVHAGWRGTLARILAKTLGRMRLEFGTKPEDIVAALGPAIGPCCYEVGPEVAQSFAGQFACAAEWFEGPFERLAAGDEPNPLPWLSMMSPGHEPARERVRLDLRAANRWQLIDAGVPPQNIAVSSLCTGCRSDLFFSYRKEGAATGRMMSVIGIRADFR
jgi:polyphenol oxidase